MHSFDVFDTLISRVTGTPKGVFIYIERLLANQPWSSPLVKCSFYKLRVSSEVNARARFVRESGHSEVLLSDIYNEMQAITGISDDEKKRLHEFEIETELSLIYGINENLDKVRALIAKGERVVFISDMYLAADDIRRLIVKVAPDLADVRIYVSSEEKDNKKGGGLYLHVKEKENLSSFTHWTHTGDNAHSDVKKAAELGINAIHFPAGCLTSIENLWIRNGGANLLEVQALSGIARKRRLTSHVPDEQYAVIGLMAPIYHYFVEWFVSQSKSNEFDNLVFLARDGLLPYLMFNELSRHRKLDIKSQYLHVSRSSVYRLNIPTPITVEQIMYLYEDVSFHNLDNVCAFLGLPEGTLYVPAPITKNKLLNKFSEVLNTRRDDIELFIKAQKEAFLSYIDKFSINDKSALVDCGWAGRIQDGLSIFLSGNGIADKLNGLYFGSKQRHYVQHSDNNKKSFMAYFPYAITAHRDLVSIVEAANKTAETSTAGYKLDEHGNATVEYAQGKPSNEEVDIDFYQSLFKDYSNDFCTYFDSSIFDWNYTEQVVAIFIAAIKQPSKELVYLLKDTTIAFDIMHLDERKIAEELTFTNVLRNIKNPLPLVYVWFSGVKVITPRHKRWLIPAHDLIFNQKGRARSIVRYFNKKTRPLVKIYNILKSPPRIRGKIGDVLVNFVRIKNKSITFVSFGTSPYGCNPRAILEEMLAQKLPYKYHWVNKDNIQHTDIPECVSQVRNKSWAARKAIASSRVWIENSHVNVFPERKPNQFFIQTWHGSFGNKTLGDMSLLKNRRWQRDGESSAKITSFLLSNSTFENDFYRRAYWKDTPIIVTGHPRNDIFFKAMDDSSADIKMKLFNDKNVNVVLYAPTFRDANHNDFELPDFSSILAALQQRFAGEWAFILRFHHLDNTNKTKVKKFESKNIVIDDNSLDMNVLYPFIDVLISDYSSVLYDFLLSGKPAFVYAPDYSHYASNVRGLCYPLESTPFAIATDNAGLLENISRHDAAAYRDKVNLFLSNKGCIEDGYASKRVVAKIRSLCEGGAPEDYFDAPAPCDFNKLSEVYDWS